ncbi:MAG: tetratricopeptide repeat protein [Myxococcales bacterium]|nr:tetratricopeptide repeat protein [Myxococcales bacterium]
MIHKPTPIVAVWLVAILLATTPAVAKRKVKPAARAEMEKALKLLKSQSAIDFAGVRTHLLNADKIQSDIPEVLFNLGVVAEMQGNMSKAEEYYKKARRSDSSYAPPIAKLGEIEFRKGNFARARQYFEEAIKLDKVNSLARNYLSRMERLKRNFPQAILHARLALMGNRENVEAYNNLAATYYEMGLYELAQLVCVSALKIHRRSPATYNLQGLLYLKTDDVKRAIEKFRDALRYDPNFFEAHLNLALSTLNFSDFNTAHHHLVLALKQKPKHVKALLAMAVSLRGLKRFDEAIATYKKVLALDSRNKEARYNLCILYHEFLQKYQQALTTCIEYQGMITTANAKYAEVQKRITGLKKTIEVLKKTPK